jgi:hypothetical protein
MTPPPPPPIPGPDNAPLPLDQRLRSISIEPAPHEWASLVARSWHAAHPDRARFRAELGLPRDRPVIMSGHQAEFWHPGILAKYLAASAAARSLDAAAAWIVVDQDTNSPAEIRYVWREKGGPIVARTWHAFPDAARLADASVPLCHIAAQQPAPPPGTGSEAAPALARIAGALGAHAGAPSVAHQVTRALETCMSDVTPIVPAVFASRLSSTSLFTDLVERMRREPLACVRAYNAAVQAHPAAGMKPLAEGEDPELPLWSLPGSLLDPKPRRRATVRTLREAPATALAPRALFMTALLRLAGCELFIHGLGGGVYDPITEQWIRGWLGRELAPAAVVTATLTLPLEVDVLPPEAIDWAVWRAHHPRHDPVLLGDRAAAAKKAELLVRIRAAKKAGEDPSPAFRELHALLAELRTDHAPVLDRLSSEAVRAGARRPEAAVLHDRTWPFPLYPLEDLAALRDAIEARFVNVRSAT